MTSKTIKKALADTLEDLSKEDFAKFRHALLDRREEPRVRRNRVEGKNYLDITDVLVSAFTEAGALDVAAGLLRQIGCSQEADRLDEECTIIKGGQSSKPGSSDTASPSAGASGNTKCTGADFVDKHRVELINRVSNIAPILDELLERKVISQETYDNIRSLRTSQEKMREIYSSGLKAGRCCKDIFWEILQKNEQFLIADLKGEQ
nr:apoptosis-associated speck-like protein containing a CARD [Lateolabrax maculatus]WJN24708.1 ASC [Lateolabrax maculatus]